MQETNERRLVVGIDGMSCQGCVRTLTDVLSALPGVARVSVSLEQKNVEIVFDPAQVKPPRFKAAIEDAGFKVVCGGNCAQAACE